jgi:hypothetical protein
VSVNSIGSSPIAAERRSASLAPAFLSGDSNLETVFSQGLKSRLHGRR